MYDNRIVEVLIPYPGVQLLCSGESCCRLVVEYLMPKLKDTDEYNGLTRADWDQVMPSMPSRLFKIYFWRLHAHAEIMLANHGNGDQ